MRGYFAHIVLLAVILAAARSVAGDAGLPLAPREGLLLLRNGRVLHGKITPVGDHYYVSFPTGEIRVDRDEVQAVCRDLDEAYRVRRQATDRSQPDQRFQLVAWCLSHGLTGYAARELAALRASDPSHPRIDFWERRLRLAMRPPDATPAAKPDQAARPPERDQLVQLARSLPGDAMETFTQYVQPLLNNKCGACHHQRAEHGFRMWRESTHRLPSSRTTRRNLQQVLNLLNRQRPAQSPLLAAALRAHGGQRLPAFSTPAHAQYQRLAQWVEQVTGDPAAGRPAAGGNPAGDVPRALDDQRPSPSIPGSPLPAAETPQHTRDRAVSTEQGATLHRSPGPSPALPRRFTPVDPFDPDVFNRRFFPADR